MAENENVEPVEETVAAEATETPATEPSVEGAPKLEEAEASEAAAESESAAAVPTEGVTAAIPQKKLERRGSRREQIGLVVSDKMDKTVTVAVYGWKVHPLYKKRMKHTRKFHAHDEENTCNEGDLVRIRESRPLSKSKRWRLVEVVKRAE